MIFNKEKKFILISIPKTASTSLMSLLDPESLHQKPDIYHQSASEFEQQNGSSITKSITMIAVVRDPFYRAVSTYCDAVYDNNHVTLSPLRKYKNFKEFIADLPRSKLNKKIRHLWPQYKFIESNNFSQKKIFYYESLDQAKDFILKIAEKEPLELPHHRKTSDRRSEIYELYNIRSLLIVLRVYIKDFIAHPRYLKSFLSILRKILKNKLKKLI